MILIIGLFLEILVDKFEEMMYLTDKIELRHNPELGEIKLITKKLECKNYGYDY